MGDMKAVRGDSLTFDVYVTRGDPPAAVNLTGAKVWFTLKKTTRDADADALIAKNSADDPAECRVLDAIAGVIRVTLLPAETDDLPVSYLPFDVQLREGDGTITTVEKGFIEVERDSTVAVT